MVRRAWVMMLVGVVLGGCGGLPFPGLGNNLSGSAASSADLNFDEVETRRFPDGQLQVRYLRNREGNDEIVCQVTVTPPAGGIAYGQDVDLPSNSGTVSRVVSDGSDFPPLKAGKIRFDSGGQSDGQRTRGRFSATFENDKTLNGAFDANLKQLGN